MKLLDEANLPQRKIFPPRLLIIFWSALMGTGAAVTIVLGRMRWREMDARNPAKILAQEILQSVTSVMPWPGPVRGIWMRLISRGFRTSRFSAKIRPPEMPSEDLSGKTNLTPRFSAASSSVAESHDRVG